MDKPTEPKTEEVHTASIPSPVAELYLPWAQSVHTGAPREEALYCKYLPAAQSWHTAPVLSEIFPAPHEVHTVTPFVIALTLPASQSGHPVAPVAAFAYLPATQALHTDSMFAAEIPRRLQLADLGTGARPRPDFLRLSRSIYGEDSSPDVQP